MGEARQGHVIVTLNLGSALREHLRGTPCRPLISDMKLHVPAMDAFYYPDVMVTCHDADKVADLAIEHPNSSLRYCLIPPYLTTVAQSSLHTAKLPAWRNTFWLMLRARGQRVFAGKLTGAGCYAISRVKLAACLNLWRW